MTETAIILAAGKAERLMPLSYKRPKCMFLLSGKPIIEHVLGAVKELGVSKVVLVIDHEDTMVRAFVGDGKGFGMNVEYVLQSGTGGSATALRLVDPQWADQGAYVFPAHLFLEPATVYPLKDAPLDTLLVAVATSNHQQGVPTVKGNRFVSSTSEVPVVGSTRVNAGIYKVSRTFLETLQEEGLEDRVLGQTLDRYAKTHEVNVRDVAGIWEVLVNPNDIVRINELALRGIDVHKGADVVIHESAVLLPPVWVGDGCHIGENAVIGPFVSMRSNCRVGPLCEVRDSILNNNVILDSRSVMRGGILDDGVITGPGFLAPDGCIVGSDAQIGSGVVLDGTQMIEADAIVPSGTVLGA